MSDLLDLTQRRKLTSLETCIDDIITDNYEADWSLIWMEFMIGENTMQMNWSFLEKNE
jgi:hypothetical protein